MNSLAVAVLVVNGAVAALGICFVFNIRGIGVRSVWWYRDNWARTRGTGVLRGPRATRILAAAVGLLWLAVDGGIAVVIARASW